MSVTNALVALEDDGWKALSTSGEAAANFYAETLADEVELLFPGGMRIRDRDAVIQSMGGEAWNSYAMDDVRVLMPTDDVGIVAYKATVQRGDAPQYVALISSVYVRRNGRWLLAFHQQTPV